MIDLVDGIWILVGVLVFFIVGVFVSMKFMVSKHESIDLAGVHCWAHNAGCDEKPTRFVIDSSPFKSSYKFACEKHWVSKGDKNV